MPETTSPTINPPVIPVPFKKNNFPKILIICAVSGFALLAIAVGALLLLNRTPTPPASKSERVRGNAGEFYPYGTVQEDKDVAEWVGADGGVVSADLANNVKAYLVVPPGSAGVEGEVYKLTPYFSMPTSNRAPALPTELGYGVDFEIENYHPATLEPLYLVFDLDQGRTVRTIATDNKVNNFCLPTIPTFNPAGCALIKGIPLTDHTSTKYGVVSPIRDLEYNDLMFMNSTVPIGYDNLIVTQITNQATFIPILLSQDVLTDVVRADKPGFSMPLIEAMVHAVNNNIYYNDPETYYNLNKALQTNGDPVDTNKALQILTKYQGYLNGLKGQAAKFANAKITADTALNYLDLQLQDYPAIAAELKDGLIKDLIAKSEISSSNAYQSLSAILEVRRLSLASFPQIQSTRAQMLDKILADIAYFVDEGNVSINNKLMFEAAIWGKPEYFRSVKTDSENLSSFPWLLKVSAAGNSVLPPDAPQSWRDFIGKIEAELNKMLENPCSYSGLELLKAAQMAQLIGRNDLADRFLQSIMNQLIANLRAGTGNLREWSMAMMFGLDNEYSCVNDLYRDQVLKQGKKRTCTTLMEKNLKNFAWNEIRCQEALLPPDPPKIPDDCKLPEPPKCSSLE